MDEHWSYWKPLEKLEALYRLETVIDKMTSLSILLLEKDSDKKLLLEFDSSLIGYRQSDETYRSSLIHSLANVYGDNFLSQWSFFKVTHSAYVAWLSDESEGIYNSAQVHHFVIMDDLLVIDIVAQGHPTCSFIS
jgi:hypothetical protein